MTSPDHINPYTLRRHSPIADYSVGDQIEDLCEDVQDAVNEVIRVCREHGQCRRVFGDLNIEVYAYPHPAGGISWGIDSLITHQNTKRGIVS